MSRKPKRSKGIKRALVLSGGGAKGAFQLGALNYINDHKPSSFKFDIIAGVSAGSLNGTLIAQGELAKLNDIWDTINYDKVYSGQLTFMRAVKQILLRKKGILGMQPVAKLIRANSDLRKISTDFRIGFVSVTSGEYTSCRHTELIDNDELANALVASCAIPVISPPVDKVRTRGALYSNLVDGGVKNNSPLKDVLADDPDEIIMINCAPRRPSPSLGAARNIFTIAKRTIAEIMLGEIFTSDIEAFVEINLIVEQCDKAKPPLKVYKPKPHGTTPYKAYKSIIIEPENDLGDSLNFSKAAINMRKDAGWEAAKDAFTKTGITKRSWA